MRDFGDGIGYFKENLEVWLLVMLKPYNKRTCEIFCIYLDTDSYVVSGGWKIG